MAHGHLDASAMASPAPVRRSQRANAGSRLRQLLDEEADAAAVDEFYQQDIFKEEEADEEFQFTGGALHATMLPRCSGDASNRCAGAPPSFH